MVGERNPKELHESDTLFLTDGDGSSNSAEGNVIIGKKLEAARVEADGSVESDGASNTELLKKEELPDSSTPGHSPPCVGELEASIPKSTDDSKIPLKKPYPLPHRISICIGGIPVLESEDLSVDQAVCSMNEVELDNVMPPNDQATDTGCCKVSGEEDQVASRKFLSGFLQVPYLRSPSELEEEKEAMELYAEQCPSR